MGINIEKRLSVLENQIKALKSTYAIYGGMMKVYFSISPWFEMNSMDSVFEFTSSFAIDNPIIISSFYVIEKNTGGDSFNFSSYAHAEVQDTIGKITIRIPVTADEVQIGIVSTVPGTFTQVQ